MASEIRQTLVGATDIQGIENSAVVLTVATSIAKRLEA
jgi:hypothetical protein